MYVYCRIVKSGFTMLQIKPKAPAENTVPV